MLGLTYSKRSLPFRGWVLVLVSALVVLRTVVLNNSGVFAIEYGGVGGRPAYPREDNPRTESIFIHNLNPGETQEEGVLIVNNTAEEKTILVYAVDSMVSSDGAFACRQLSDPKYDVGAWVTLEKSEVTLDSGTNELVPFTIRVPEDAGVGEHNGCITIQEKKEEVGGQVGMKLSFRTGLRVAVTVPGEITRSLKIADFKVERSDEGGYRLRPVVKNLGNVSIDTDVAVVTRYFFGPTLFKHGGRFPVLSGQTSTWNFELKQPFWGGWYRSTLTVEYDEGLEAGVGVKSGEELTKLEGPSVWFYSPPTTAGLVIEVIVLLALAALLLLLAFSRKRKRWVAKAWIEYETQAGDDIKSLAERLGVSWKLLAKANKLKPPYTLAAGEKIKVPPIN